MLNCFFLDLSVVLTCLHYVLALYSTRATVPDMPNVTYRTMAPDISYVSKTVIGYCHVAPVRLTRDKDSLSIVPSQRVRIFDASSSSAETLKH